MNKYEENVLIRKRILEIKDDDERHREIAYWALQSIDELKPKRPPTPPAEWLRFKAKPIDEQRGVADDFWREPNIAGFLDQRQKINNENKANLQWLEQIHSWLPAGDHANRRKVDTVIQEHQVFEHGQEVDNFQASIN